MKQQKWRLVLAILGLMAAVPALSAGRSVAVLEFDGGRDAGVSAADKQQLIETVRGIARRHLPKGEGWVVLTRAELEAKMPSGLDLSNCADEKCIVAAGRKLGVDYLVSENMGRIGSYLQVSFSLYDVAEGKLIGSEWPRGKTADDIIDSLESSPDRLFAALGNPAPPEAAAQVNAGIPAESGATQAVPQSQENQVILYDDDDSYYGGVIVDPVYPYPYYCCGPYWGGYWGGRGHWGGGGGHFHGGGHGRR